MLTDEDDPRLSWRMRLLVEDLRAVCRSLDGRFATFDKESLQWHVRTKWPAAFQRPLGLASSMPQHLLQQLATHVASGVDETWRLPCASRFRSTRASSVRGLEKHASDQNHSPQPHLRSRFSWKSRLRAACGTMTPRSRTNFTGSSLNSRLNFCRCFDAIPVSFGAS